MAKVEVIYSSQSVATLMMLEKAEFEVSASAQVASPHAGCCCLTLSFATTASKDPRAVKSVVDFILKRKTDQDARAKLMDHVLYNVMIANLYK